MLKCVLGFIYVILVFYPTTELMPVVQNSSITVHSPSVTMTRTKLILIVPSIIKETVAYLPQLHVYEG